MALYETLDATLERRKRMAAKYPQLSGTDPDTVLKVDAYSASQGRLPTQLTQDAVRTANEVRQARNPMALDLGGTRNPFALDVPEPTGSGGGFLDRVGDVLGDVGGFALDRIRATGPMDPFLAGGGNTSPDAAPLTQRVSDVAAGNLRNVDRVTGAPIRGALLNPSNIPQGVVDAVRNPEQAQLRNMGGIRSLPDNDIIGPLSVRDIAGGVADAAADVGTVATLGTAAGRNLVRRGVQSTRDLPVGLSIRNVARDEALDPFESARGKILDATSREAQIRSSGLADLEIGSGRTRQARGVMEGVESATGTEALQAARTGAKTGQLRTILAEPIELTEDEIAAAVDRVATIAREQNKPFSILQMGDVLDRLQEGRGLQPGQIDLVKSVFGEDVARSLQSRPPNVEPRIVTPGGIQMERNRIAQEAERAARRALDVSQRDSIRAVEQRIKELGGDIDLPIPPRPSDDIYALAGLPGNSPQIQAAKRIVKGYETAVAKAAAGEEKAFLAEMTEIARERARLEQIEVRQANQTRAAYERAAARDVDDATRYFERVERDLARAQEAANRLDQREIDYLRRYNARAEARQAASTNAVDRAAYERSVRLREALDQKYPNTEVLMQKVDELTRGVGPSQTTMPMQDPWARQVVETWLEKNRAILDTMGDSTGGAFAAVNAQITGNVADSWLTAALQNRNLLNGMLRAELGDTVAKTISDSLFEAELLRRYKASSVDKIPQQARDIIATAKNLPYEESLGAVSTFVQRFKNTQFGIGDFAVLGVQGWNALRRNPVQFIAGSVNRALAKANLPHISTIEDATALARREQYALDGLMYSRTGMTQPEAGSLLRYLGAPGKALDKPLTDLSEKMTDIQFTSVLGTLREIDHEGNLVLLKLLGRDISDPAVRAQSAAMANHATSAAQSALRRARSTKESILLTSPSMTRARVANIVDMAKLITPSASPEQRIIAATTILGTVMSTVAIGKAVHDAFGEPTADFIMDPSLPGFGTVTTRFKDAKGRNIVIDLIPQDAVDRAVATSVRAIAELDPETAAKAWAKVAIGSSSIVGRGIGELFNTGYEPGRGYRFGDIDTDLEARAQRLSPLPPGVQSATQEGLGVIQTPLEGIGISNYPESGYRATLRGARSELPPREQFNTIATEAWRIMGNQDALKKLLGDASGIGAWYGETYDKVYDQLRAAGLTEGQAQVEADKAVQQHPVYQAYTELKGVLRTQWVVQNPEEAIKFWNEQSRKPWDEREWTPNAEQREIMDSYLAATRRAETPLSGAGR